MGEVIDENDLGRHIRYRHRISSARWSSSDNLWTLEATRTDTGEAVRFTANFLWMCQGYYRHSRGLHARMGAGWRTSRAGSFTRRTWPEDLDYAGKKVVVIGSGATAATLIPAIAADCGHVTMLQRSPTFFRTGRNAIAIADELRELGIDETWIHEIVRKKILHEQAVFTRRSFTEPEVVKQELLAAVRALSGARLRHRQRTSRRATGHGGSASPSFPTATSSRRSAPARHRSSPTKSRRFTRDRHSAEVRQGARSRHHRHGHRLQSQCARRHRLHHRRQAAGLLRYGHLSRHDVHRRAQHGVGLRIFPSQLDAAGGPGRRLRVPAAQSHEGKGRAAR